MEGDLFTQMLLVLGVIVLERVVVWFAKDVWRFKKSKP